MKHIHIAVLTASLLSYSANANANFFIGLIPEIVDIATTLYTGTNNRGIIVLKRGTIIIKQMFRAIDNKTGRKVIVSKGSYTNISRNRAVIEFEARKGTFITVSMKYVTTYR